MWRNTDTSVFRGDIVLRKAYTRYPFGGLPRHFVPRNDMLERNAFIRVFPQICFDYACGSAETYHYIIALYSSATPRRGISSVADGFHLAQQDFICRQANFIARTVDLTLSIKRLCPHCLCNNQIAFAQFAFTTTKTPLTFYPYYK